MKYNTSEEYLAELTARYIEITKAMASIKEPSLFDVDWFKKNILQIKDNEGE